MKKTLMIGMVSFLVHCSGNGNTISDAQNALATWESKNILHYSYTIEGTGFSFPGESVIEAQCGEIINGPGSTISELLISIIESGDGECLISASFDDEFGVPVERFDDCGEEGSGYRISDFTVVDALVDCI